MAAKVQRKANIGGWWIHYDKWKACYHSPHGEVYGGYYLTKEEAELVEKGLRERTDTSA
jgi:hypothetical protein